MKRVNRANLSHFELENTNDSTSLKLKPSRFFAFFFLFFFLINQCFVRQSTFFTRRYCFYNVWYVNEWKSGALKVKFLRSFGSCRVLEYIYTTVNLLNEGFVHHRKGNAIVGTSDQKNNKQYSSRSFQLSTNSNFPKRRKFVLQVFFLKRRKIYFAE